MGKVFEQKIDRFDKGIINDPRIDDSRYSQLIKNFDAHTYPKKLVPYRSSESGDTAASTSKKQNFCVALRTGTTYSLYALGVKSGADTAEVLYKNLTQASANDLIDGGWQATGAAAKYQSASGVTNFNLFVYYAKVGRIFGAKAGTTIWVYDPAGSADFLEDGTGNSRSITYTNIAQGLVHSKDDILYIPYDNKIAKNDNGSWTNTALTLPAHFYITSICEYGNFLAIACAPLSGIGSSRVFLWDRDASNTVLTESIDFGEGNLQILEEVEGHLIGISKQGIGESGQTNKFKGQITIRQYSGGVAEVLKTFISEGNDVVLPIFKQKVDHFLYFLMDISIAGSSADYLHQGLWKIGRVSSDTPFALTFDRNVNNNVAGTYVMKAFQVVGDYVFLSYTTSGTFALDKTNNNETWVAGNFSYYDSQIFNLGDSSIIKQLKGATIFTEALGGTQSIVLAYKKDEDITSGSASWTTLFTLTTANSLSFSVSSDVEFKEIQFRITSEKGTKAILGFKFKAEPISKDIY